MVSLLTSSRAMFDLARHVVEPGPPSGMGRVRQAATKTGAGACRRLTARVGCVTQTVPSKAAFLALGHHPMSGPAIRIVSEAFQAGGLFRSVLCFAGKPGRHIAGADGPFAAEWVVTQPGARSRRTCELVERIGAGCTAGRARHPAFGQCTPGHALTRTSRRSRAASVIRGRGSVVRAGAAVALCETAGRDRQSESDRCATQSSHGTPRSPSSHAPA